VPRDIRTELPDEVFELPDEQREARADIDGDFCRLDEERYFVRGLIEMPIRNGGYFGYGVWIEVAEDDCFRLIDFWHDGPTGESFSGRLANELDTYPGSRGLRVSFETREQLPAVQIEDDHLLASEQRAGISERRADDLASSGYH
jgi:hypothetical protein